MKRKGQAAVLAPERPPTGGPTPLMEVRNLGVCFHQAHGTVHAVQDVSWEIRSGDTLGIVGESGSGKSITAFALMDLVPMTGEVTSGEFFWRGQQVEQRELAKLRGSQISMVFQDPVNALNPLVPVGRQITEVLRKHKGMSSAAAKARAVELFDLVGIPEPARRLKQYPFEFSGGMAQRAVIAMAIAPEPELLIADEPTTALDVTIQAQILDLIAQVQAELGIAVVLITHDLGVVAGVADRIAVMYAGRVVETGPARQIFEHPTHPYTEGLLASTPHPRSVLDRLVPIPGNPPVVTEVLDACSFADRCGYATSECTEHRPRLEVVPDLGPDRKAACWHVR